MADYAHLVTIGLDCAALFIVVLLLIQERIHSDRTMSGKLFFGMTLTVMIIAVFDLIAYALYMRTEAWCFYLEITARTIAIYAILCLVYEWYLYVDFRLFGSEDHIRRRYWLLFVPLLIHGICLLINPFTGIVFTVNSDMSFTPQPMYYVIQVTNYLYFLAAAVLILYENRRGEKKRFFHPEWMFISVIAGEILNAFLPLHITPLDIAVGLLLVWIALSRSFELSDESSGFYNRRYLSVIQKRLSSGEKAYRSAMTFETAGSVEPLIAILQEEMPVDGEMIRIGEKSFLLCMEQSDRLALKLLQQNVEEAADEHDRTASTQKIGLKTDCRLCGNEAEMAALLQNLEEKRHLP